MSNQELKLTACPVSLEFAQGENPGPPRFKMTAYNGGPVNLCGFDVPVIVDLEGMDISKESIPVRLDHDPTQRIGHTTRLAIADHSLTAEGLISHDNEYARTVAASGKNGFPWQVSIGAWMTESENLKTGESAVVNGYDVEGPMIIARRSVLMELSFVDYGADSTTSALVAQRKEMQMENKTDESKAIDLALGEMTSAPAPVSEPKPVEAKQNADETQAALRAMREAAAAETKRIAAITKMARPGAEELQAKAIEENWSAEQFELEMMKKELADLRAARPDAPAIHRADGDVTDQVLMAVAAQSFGTLRGAPAEKMFDEKTLTAAEKYVGCGLRTFVELACRKRIDADPRREPTEWLHAAFDATSLPGILSNTANKVLLAGYESVEDVWPKAFKKGAVADFKTHTRYRLLSNMTFQKVAPGGELKHGELGEQQFTQKADTYGIMFALTREMIINDDLGALYDLPYQIGVGAAEAVSDAVWGLVLGNPVLADGSQFFSAGNGSLLTNTPLSVAGLTAAKTAFYKKTQPNGRPLNVRPKYLLVPPELEDQANILVTAELVNELTGTNDPAANRNPHRGAYDILVCPYLSNASYAGASGKDWYLVADPNRIPAFEIAFLGGKDRPTVERADADFNVLGVQFRGYLDFGVKEQDFRGILKVQGN